METLGLFYALADRIGGMDIAGVAVASIFIIIGIGQLVIPPRHILKWDKGAGRSVYLKTLASSGSEERALAEVGKVYKAFGLVFISMGVLALVTLHWQTVH